MKKYIAPELEMLNFTAEDVITTSATDPVPGLINKTGDESYTLTAAMADIEWNQ